MSAVRKALKRLREEQSGLSFVEIMVAITLTTVIMIMVTSMFIQTAKISTAAGQIRDANGNASNIANRVTSVLRVATSNPRQNSTPEPAVVDGTRSSLTIYSLSDVTNPTSPAPVKVTFTFTPATASKPGFVTEVRCTGNTSGSYFTFSPCASSTSRVIGDGVLAPTGPANQLFTYMDVNGTVLVPGTGGTGSLTAAQEAIVASIIVTVRTQQKGSTTQPVLVSNTVVLRNIGLDTGT